MKGITINHDLLHGLNEIMLELSDAEFEFLELLVSQAKAQREFIKTRPAADCYDVKSADRAKELLRNLMGDRT